MSSPARLAGLAACCCLLACSDSGIETGSLSQPNQFNVELLVEGARVFDERCAACHGDHGRGDGVLADVLPVRPRNYHAEPFKWGSEPEAIVRTIRQGRSGVMPPFEGALTPRETWAAAYLVWHWIPEERRGSSATETRKSP